MKSIKTVLVTGGAGYIGSHTCLYLLEQDYKVFVIDSLVNSSSESLERIKFILKKDKQRKDKNLKFYQGSLNNKEFIDGVFFKASNELKAKIVP